MESRYIIGIDLGTTNCALSYLDTLDLKKGIRVLSIPQWERNGALISSESLPSFCYLPPKNAYKKGEFKLPFESYNEEDVESKVIGSYARKQMSLTPDRVIHAAKSWLSHRGVDSNEAILPWHSDTLIGDQRLSPIEVSSLYLKHLQAVWDHEMASFEEAYRFQFQRVIITVPASFDEIASQYTFQAAQVAGYSIENVSLLEEPQAAFYYWLQSLAPIASDNFADFLKVSASKAKDVFFGCGTGFKKVLICDIGGGTTDFSLLELDAQGESLDVSRIAVSDHILLGGDNIDLKIAYFLENKLREEKKIKTLHSHQWTALVAEARELKERSLSFFGADWDGEELHVAIAGTGSSLFDGRASTSVDPRAIRKLVLDSFFPKCQRDEIANESRSGLKEFGLPYAKDGAISRHLSSFLRGYSIDAVLFTGGTLVPAYLQDILRKQIGMWQKNEPIILNNDAMHLAVAKGAAWFGASVYFKQGKIKSGYPRNLYVEVSVGASKPRMLMSVLPKGFVGGDSIKLDKQNVKVVLGQPVSFQMFCSLQSDPILPGSLVSMSDIRDIKKMPPLQTKLGLPEKTKKKNREPELVAVNLELGLSETGLLAIDCVAKEGEKPSLQGHKWRLSFNVQESAVTRQSSSVEQTHEKQSTGFYATDCFKQVQEIIGEVYGKARPGTVIVNPNKLSREIETTIGLTRDRWGVEQLRGIWESLSKGETRRGRSESHETTWLNLSGFCLRPGYGDSLDKFRMEEVWNAFERGMAFPKGKQVQSQWWILWRRVSGGLDKKKQEKLFAKIAPHIRKGAANPEMYMLAGSLELVSVNKKVQLGSSLVKQIKERKPEYLSQKIWALARIASRVPLYSGPENIIRPSFVQSWIDELSALDFTAPQYRGLLHFFVQSGRLVGDRELDLSEEYRERLVSFIAKFDQGSCYIQQLLEVKPLDLAGQSQLFGESLPAGFMI
ncbi:MAG: Hsp70 family protein [Oligoflexales bacterium]